MEITAVNLWNQFVKTESLDLLDLLHKIKGNLVNMNN